MVLSGISGSSGCAICAAALFGLLIRQTAPPKIRLQGQGTINAFGTIRRMNGDGKIRPAGALPPAVQAALLVMIAGYADAIGFLQFRAFAGQMTGNTILLAISMVEAHWSQSAYYVAVIASFLVGVVISGSLVRLGAAPAIALSLSAASLAICSFVTTHWGALLLAFAMGAQNAASTRFGDATINTVFITGDLQKLFEAVLDWLWPGKSRQVPPGLGILALVW